MQTATDNLEIEVKFFLENPGPMQEKLVLVGARAQAKVFETNMRYENRENTLKDQGRLLRLRQDRTCRLTLKSRPGHPDADYKVHHELEVGISDCTTMAAILDGLGFLPVQTYEKWRQTFMLEKTLVCLDTMPYGDFIEIEGSKEAIRSVADQLGLAWPERILSSYLAMFDLLREKENLPFGDLTFDHFKHYPVAIKPYIALFQSGHRTTHQPTKAPH